MSIGSVSDSGSWYSLGGKSLGVQLGTKSGTDLIGGATSADSLFAATTSNTGGVSVDTKDIVVKAMQDQIDRIQGFRTNLTTAEKQELAGYQTVIQEYNELASTRTLTTDEAGVRAEAYLDAYALLGKEYEDFTNDSFIQNKSEALDDLIATKPVGSNADRLESLEGIREHLVEKSYDYDSIPDALNQQLLSISRQIATLTAPRDISTFSPEELRQHDELVDEINEYAGFELELDSTKKLQIERLEANIELIQSGVTQGLYA